jgi:hypothetical protein
MDGRLQHGDVDGVFLYLFRKRGAENRVHGFRSSESRPDHYRLILVSPVELSELYLTVANIASSSKPIKNGEPLKLASYPANQKIVVDLPAFPTTGLYRVELIGYRRDEGSVTTQPFLINVSR